MLGMTRVAVDFSTEEGTLKVRPPGPAPESIAWIKGAQEVESRFRELTKPRMLTHLRLFYPR